MKVLVTGGLGFIGSAIARALVLQKHDVSVIDNRLPGHGSNNRNIADIRGSLAAFVEGDVRDQELLARLVKNCDSVVHAAAHVSHTAGIAQPELDVEGNVVATVRLAQAIVQHAPSANLVFLSTRGVYGSPASLPVDETQPCDPLGPHEWSKLSAESFLRTWSRLHGLRTTVLRLTNIYGPGSQIRNHHFGVINWFIGQSIQGKPIPVFGDGTVRRDLVYVADAADAVLRALEQPSPDFRLFNVGNPEAQTLHTIAGLIVSATGQGDVELRPYSTDRRRMEVGDFASDIRKIQAVLGWSPHTALADGIARTVSYYRAFLPEYLGD